MSLQTALAENPAEWHTLPCDFDDALAGRAAIGLLALASDGVIESELRKFLPADGVAVYTTRLPRIPDTTPPSLRLMEQGEWFAFVCYVVGSVVLTIGACALGYFAMRGALQG